MQIVDRLRIALQNQNSFGQEDLERLVLEYNNLCRETNSRLRQCLELIDRRDSEEALRLAEAPPNLLELLAQLDFPERDAFTEIASEIGVSLESLHTDASQALLRVYAESYHIRHMGHSATGPGQPQLPSQRNVDPDHPWLGLSPYTEDTTEYFFGRDAEVRDLYLRVREQPLTILYGQSGLGKTSLLGAGLIPKLRVEGYRPSLLRLGHEPTDLPLIEQVLSIPSLAAASESATSTTLWERFHHIAGRPADFASSPPVLIFDQFEELFTLASSKVRQAEAAELFRQLADLIENRPPQAVQDRMRSDRRSAREYDLGTSPVRVVITLREDFLSHLEAYKKLMPSLMRNRMAVFMLNGPQALEAVVRPGRLQGSNLVSDEVGARIVRFVANRSPETPLEEIGAVPPLLSLLCDELNQLRIEQQQPMIASGENAFAGLESLGRNILDGFYTRSFAGLHPAVRDYIEDRMVTIGGHRNPIAFEDAIADLTASDVSDPGTALNQLIRGRLLSIEDRNGVQRLEITHDVLTPLVVRSRDERRERQRAEKAELEKIAIRGREISIRRLNLKWRVISAAMGFLAVTAIAGMAWALFASHKSRLQLRTIEKQQADLLDSNVRIDDLRYEASTTDRVIATNLWDLGRRHDAMAHWARSLDYDPDSSREIEQIFANVSSTPWDYPFLTLLDRSENNILVMSPDGTRVVTGYKWNSVMIWDAISGAELVELVRPGSPFGSATFSPDGAVVFTTHGYDEYVVAWNTVTGEEIFCLQNDGSQKSAEVSTNGMYVAAVTTDDSVSIWDANTGKLSSTLRCNHSVDFVSLSPDGMRVLMFCSGKAIEIWDVLTGAQIGTLDGQDADVTTAEFSPNGKRVVNISEGKSAKLWDASSGKELMTVSDKDSTVSFAKVSPDGSRVITVCAEKHSAAVWSADSGALEYELEGHSAPVVSAEFSPDGTRIVTLSLDKTAKLWNANSGAAQMDLRFHEGNVFRAVFVGDGSRIVTLAEDGRIQFWDVSTSDANTLQFEDASTACTAKWSHDGDRIFTYLTNFTHGSSVRLFGFSDNEPVTIKNVVRIWDSRNGCCRSTLNIREHDLICVGISPAETRVVTGIASSDAAKIWDASSGQEIRQLAGHTGRIETARYSADGRQIVTGSNDKTARIWDGDSGQTLAVLTGHTDTVETAEFSEDGHFVVTSSNDHTARIWDVSTGRTISVLKDDKSPIENAIFFDGSGTVLTSHNYNKMQRLWDSNTGKPKSALMHKVTMSADGKRILEYSDLDDTTVLRDAETDEFIANLAHSGSTIKNAGFSSDSSRIVTCSDNTIQVWSSETGDLLLSIVDSETEFINAEFNSDSTRIVASCDYGKARIWNLAAVKSAPPAWFSQFLRVYGGRTHNSWGQVEEWPADVELNDSDGDWLAAADSRRRMDLDELRSAISSDKSRYADLAQFLLTPHPQKPLFAGSTVSRACAADQIIDLHAPKSDLLRAHNWHVGHPLIQIALAKFEDNETRATFLREYGVSRLLKRPPSAQETAADIAALCRRAEAFLTDQNDQPRT